MAEDIKKVFENLHESLVASLLNKVQSGEATAAELNVARQMLKDNGIDMMARRGSPLSKLADVLPFKDPEQPIAKVGGE